MSVFQLRKAKSLIKQAAKKREEDDANDSTDQKSTDSKLEDESSTGTDENKLEESEKGKVDDMYRTTLGELASPLLHSPCGGIYSILIERFMVTFLA